MDGFQSQVQKRYVNLLVSFETDESLALSFHGLGDYNGGFLGLILRKDCFIPFDPQIRAGGSPAEETGLKASPQAGSHLKTSEASNSVELLFVAVLLLASIESTSCPETRFDRAVSAYNYIFLSLKYVNKFLRNRQRLYLMLGYLLIREEYSSSFLLSSSTVGTSPAKSISSPTAKAGVEEICSIRAVR